MSNAKNIIIINMVFLCLFLYSYLKLSLQLIVVYTIGNIEKSKQQVFAYSIRLIL